MTSVSSPQVSRPWNYLYAVSKLLVLVALLPYDALVYSVWPAKRPRPSWTLVETVLLLAVRRFLALVDTAGFTISSRDVFATPSDRDRTKLAHQGIHFEWFDHGPIDPDLVDESVIDDPDVAPRDKVGVFSWYRDRSPAPAPATGSGPASDSPLVGIFFHGGAFRHNCAHPKAHSTIMPRTLFEREPRFVAMHSVEFRLLPEFPFPAQLQDAAAVYVGLLKRGVDPREIVLIGDSSGANIALSLARWVRDSLEKQDDETRTRARVSTSYAGTPIRWTLGDPLGLILFSPWIDPSHSFLDCAPRDYVARSNECDYLLEEGPFRHALVESLLGRHRAREFVLSPYLSPGRVGVRRGTFVGHRPTFVAYGTGERGEAECARFVDSARRDGVQVAVTRTDDTPHDVLLLGFWNRTRRDEVWDGALTFLKSLDSHASAARQTE
ncbi:hypothetical protein JCM11491_005011 [Sporobolomyces phaffii]